MKRTIEYLASQAALDSIATDPYWPKWDSPWWHMTLLWEMGEARRIPPETLATMLEAIRRMPREEDCFCALATMFQIAGDAGLDADQELPWARSWFMKHQLRDGGLTCDMEVYATHADSPTPPSSMVGTIAPLEAILFHTRRPFTPEEITFLDRGAEFLMRRQLMRGSHDEEREDEQDWLKPCFPRFYLYDVLRGLSWLTKWSRLLGRKVPIEAIEPVARHLEKTFPDGRILKQRHAIAGITTRPRPRPASTFALLNEVSILGKESEHLSAQWRRMRIDILPAALR